MPIANCDCIHEGQDGLHGKKMRVFNRGIKGYKCSVCGKIKDLKTK